MNKLNDNNTEEEIVIQIRDKEGNLIRIELSKWEQLVLARKNNELLRKQKKEMNLRLFITPRKKNDK